MFIFIIFYLYQGQINIFINKNNNKKEKASGACEAHANKWIPPASCRRCVQRYSMTKISQPSYHPKHLMEVKLMGRYVLLQSQWFGNSWFFFFSTYFFFPLFKIHVRSVKN